MNEHHAQRLTVAWFRATYPDLEPLLFAIPNGGARHPATARRLNEEGVRAGVPDLLLALPRGPWHGLWLELKAAQRGTVRPAQKAMHAALRGQSYRVEVPRGYEAAKAAITAYLETGDLNHA